MPWSPVAHWSVEFPSWPVALLTIPIVLRAAIVFGVVVVAPGQLEQNHIVPAFIQLGVAFLFAALGGVLTHYGRSDRRAWGLGLFLVDAGSTMATPFVAPLAHAMSSDERLPKSIMTSEEEEALWWRRDPDSAVRSPYLPFKRIGHGRYQRLIDGDVLVVAAGGD